MGAIKPWRELEREQIADCRIFTVERSIAESPVDRSRHSRYRIVSPDWAQIVPVTAAGEVVMIREFRHGSQRFGLEVPGGIIEPGERPEQAAVRECLEETGYRAVAPVSLGVLNPNPALFGNALHTFFATGVERVAEIHNTPAEQTEVVLVPREDLPKLLVGGEIDHGLIVATLWRYVHEHLRAG